MTKVVAIGLDGLELSQAERLLAAGRMPALAALRERGMTARLDHGPAGRTGLAWEHFASGSSPADANRASAVEFDPATYEVWQEGARFRPFWDALDVRTLVLDPPYVDLGLSPATTGVVAWGAHDPGTTFATRPASLADEVPAYPAAPWTYAVPWSSIERCTAMGEALVEGLRLRRELACRLLRERPDWDLFVVVAGEPHGCTEALWHGVDPTHPAFDHPSRPAAAKAFEDTYGALDTLIAEVVAAVGPDTHVVAFAMGGMGRNESDVPSMFLLSELLHREAFGSPLAVSPDAWQDIPAHELTIPEGENWEHVVNRCFPDVRVGGGINRVAGRGRRALRRLLPERPADAPERPRESLDWMPASRYQPLWPAMRAFALPSFYDGRVRINLAGRESRGIVALADYDRVCEELEDLLRACRDPHTGEPVVGDVERPGRSDPRALRSDEADLVVVWRGAFNGIVHPTHGRVGPVPFRRTGGHTGPYGTLAVAGPGIEPGDVGVVSSFEVAGLVSRLLTGQPALPQS